MSEHVIGDWKKFNFRMIQPSDLPLILEHLRGNFYRDEPLLRHSGYDDILADDMDTYLKAAVPKALSLSFVAIDKETNKIAGVRITSKKTKGEPELYEDMEFKSPKTGPLLELYVAILKKLNVYERYPDLESYADFAMVSVAKEYRGCGLASEIYNRSLRMLMILEFSLITCVFTSPYTQKIARRNAFEEVGQINFVDWKDEKGEKYWKDAAEDECAIVMVKELKPLRKLSV